MSIALHLFVVWSDGKTAIYKALSSTWSGILLFHVDWLVQLQILNHSMCISFLWYYFWISSSFGAKRLYRVIISLDWNLTAKLLKRRKWFFFLKAVQLPWWKLVSLFLIFVILIMLLKLKSAKWWWYILLQGDFLVHFMDIARDELTKKLDEISVEKLQVWSFTIIRFLSFKTFHYLSRFRSD